MKLTINVTFRVQISVFVIFLITNKIAKYIIGVQIHLFGHPKCQNVFPPKKKMPKRVGIFVDKSNTENIFTLLPILDFRFRLLQLIFIKLVDVNDLLKHLKLRDCVLLNLR